MQSIVLSRRDFRETDQIIRLYTKEKGKLELLARGIKKITSKQAAHCEPFSYNMIEVATGREIDHLIKVVPIDSFSSIRRDMKKSIAAGYAMSCVDAQLDVRQPDGRVWSLLLDWLHFLEHGDVVDTLLLDAFVFCFFALLGFRPILDRCVVSGISYADMVRDELEGSKASSVQRPASGLYFAGGGLVSSEVRREKQRVGEEIAACGLTDVSNLQLLLTGNWRTIQESPLSEKEKKNVHKLVLAYVQYHSQKEVKDWELVL